MTDTTGLTTWQKFVLWTHEHSSASHILVGAAFYGVGVLMALPLVWLKLIEQGGVTWFGSLAVLWFFLGRERRDREIDTGLPQAALVFRQWDFWNWGGDNRRDFLYPAGAWLLVSILATGCSYAWTHIAAMVARVLSVV